MDENSSVDFEQSLPATSGAAAADDYVQSIDHIAAVAEEAHHAIDRFVAALQESRRQRLNGGEVPGLVGHVFGPGGQELRAASTAALSNYSRAITTYRATLVRILVDEERMTLSAVAQLFGVSRQMVARLYRTATTQPRDSERPQAAEPEPASATSRLRQGNWYPPYREGE
jgi:hypothetical protein